MCGLALARTTPAEAPPPLVPSHLVHRAATTGSVRVIVQVGGPAMPEATLPGDVAVAAQRQTIATAQSAVLSRLAGVRHRVLRQYTTVPFLAVEVDAYALTVLERLRGLVVTVEEDVLHRPTLAQSVPLVQAPSAWGAGFSGGGQVIAILDTGVDKTHPVLAGKVVEEACFSLGADLAPGAGDCPNGLSTQMGPGSGVPCTYAPSVCRHGTHVAGIAAGASGVAPGAQIMAIQVFSRFTGPFYCAGGEDPCARAWTSDIVAGLDRVNAIRGTRSFAAANLSLGFGTFTTTCDAFDSASKAMIDALRAAGIATVVASGNDGYVNALSSPACISTAISVGSTTDGGPGGTPVNRASLFSNAAPFLSLLAPGQVITSSVPGGGFAAFEGTSMAAPHVAGAWAILKQLQPSAGVTGILATLRNTGLPILDPGNGIVFPRIRLFNALAALIPPPNPCSSAPTNFASGDYDGDGTGDAGVYGMSTGVWNIRRSGDLGLTQLAWGAPALGDVPVPGDYDGDGTTDIAVFRRSTGVWYIRRSGDLGLMQVSWGAAALDDVPVPGNYTEAGPTPRTDIAVYRRSTGTWYIRRATDGGLTQVTWGSPTFKDVPVQGDYDGDGRTDVGVYRAMTGEWFLRRSIDGALVQFAWGAPALVDTPPTCR
jgi:subtilisin family serine protease